jgi:tetratricopeptide (TPR) repeat protein
MAGQYVLMAALGGASVAASFLILPTEGERAAMHMRDREFDEARALFEARLAQDGPQIGTVAPLARLYAQQGELDRAIAMLENLMAAQTLPLADIVEARKLLRVYLRWASRLDAQRANLAALAQLEPARVYLRELAALDDFAGDPVRQIEALAQLIQLPDAEANDFADLAELRAGRRDFAGAAAALAALAARNPAAIDAGLFDLWLSVTLETGDVDAAVALAQVQLKPDSAPAMVAVVTNAFLGRGRPQDALRALAPIEARLGTDPGVNLAVMRAASDAQDSALLGRLFDAQLARGTAALRPSQTGELIEFGFAAGREGPALELARAIDAKALNDPQLMLLAGQALARRQLTLLRAVVAQAGPQRFDADPVLAAQIFLALDDKPAASAAASRAAARSGLPLDSALSLVQIFAALDRPSDALRLLETLAGDAALPESALADMAQLYLVLRRAPEGAATFERLRTVRPDSYAAATGWALTMAAAGRDAAVARWLDAGALALPSTVLNDLFFIGADAKSAVLQLAAARRLRALEGPTPAARLRLAQAELAAGRAAAALDEARALRGQIGGDEVEGLYREALSQAARTDAAARNELRGYWRARLADTALAPAIRDEALYALIDQRAWDDALPELARRARAAPAEWLGAYVSAARDAGRSAAVVALLQSFAADPALDKAAREQAAYALIEAAPAQALGSLRRMAADFGGEWQDALDTALERANLRAELRASLAARAQAPGLAADRRRGFAFRLLDLGDKAAALAIFQRLAEGGAADASDAEQARFLMGPRPEPAQLEWLEAQARATTGAVRLGWVRALLDGGAARRAAFVLEEDAATPGRAGGTASVLASEAYLADGDRVGAARILAARIPRETQPDLAQRLGELAQAAQRPDLARLAFDRLFLLEPSRPAAQRQAGLNAFAEGDTARARDLLQRYLAGSPGDWEAHYALGETLIRLRERAAARAEHEAALAAIDALRDPPVAARAARAYSLYRLGRNDEALAAFARLLREQPANRDLRADYAGVLLELGRTSQARAVLEGGT